MRNAALIALSVFLVGWGSLFWVSSSSDQSVAGSSGPHLASVRSLTAAGEESEDGTIYYNDAPNPEEPCYDCGSVDPPYTYPQAVDPASQEEGGWWQSEVAAPEEEGGWWQSEVVAPEDIEAQYAESYYEFPYDVVLPEDQGPYGPFDSELYFNDGGNSPYFDMQYPDEQPWYVRDFPGFGQMAQYAIPGLAPAPRYPTLQSAPIVSAPAAPSYPVPYCTISASPHNIAYAGSTVVKWSSSFAQRASLTRVGSVPVSGSRSISNLTMDDTFTLDVSGQGGSAQCDTSVNVAEQSGPPSCVISTRPDSIKKGEQASLVWGSENATSATLSGVGSVQSQGARTIAPTSPQTYTLTVRSQSGQSATCSASIAVH